jgi:hypothetical protein
MVTSEQCFAKYGDPYMEKHMALFVVPSELRQGKIPAKIYCNKDLVSPLKSAFANLIHREYIDELKTWDGCFSIRQIRGSNSMSLHSWGIAIDVNAAENGLGKEPKLSFGFVKCFTDVGFDWGGYWKRKDGMHFQLSKI